MAGISRAEDPEAREPSLNGVPSEHQTHHRADRLGRVLRAKYKRRPIGRSALYMRRPLDNRFHLGTALPGPPLSPAACILVPLSPLIPSTMQVHRTPHCRPN